MELSNYREKLRQHLINIEDIRKEVIKSKPSTFIEGKVKDKVDEFLKTIEADSFQAYSFISDVESCVFEEDIESILEANEFDYS